MQMLYEKWWKEYGGAGQCDTGDDNTRKDANALTIANVGGVFGVLIVGLVLSPFVAAFEFVWNTRRRRRRRANSHSFDEHAVPSIELLLLVYTDHWLTCSNSTECYFLPF